MYQSFYGLKEPPFRISPDPRFLFLAPQHQEVLAKCQYMVSGRVGPVYVYGPIGSGKTTIARRLHQQFADEPGYRVVMLSAPDLKSPNAFLRTVMDEFGVKTERAFDRSLANFSHYLLDEFKAGRTPVLLVDEAQHLRRPILQLLKFMLNYETNTQKLIQLVLFGQTELADHIARLPELRSRMFPSALPELSPEDTAEMITWRFRTAGGTDVPFTQRALVSVFNLSGGLPREVCRLCDLALLAGFQRNALTIDTPLIEYVGKELGLRAPAPKGVSGG
jgi:general secretion pathway protein A